MAESNFVVIPAEVIKNSQPLYAATGSPPASIEGDRWINTGLITTIDFKSEEKYVESQEIRTRIFLLTMVIHMVTGDPIKISGSVRQEDKGHFSTSTKKIQELALKIGLPDPTVVRW